MITPAFHQPPQCPSTQLPSNSYYIITIEEMSHSYINNHGTAPPNNTNFSHDTNSFNPRYTHISNSDCVLNVNVSAINERSEILEWLSPLEPRIRHQDLRTRRADSVGEWLLQTDEFQRWCGGAEQDGSEHAALFCCGGPAVGKTYFR